MPSHRYLNSWRGVCPVAVGTHWLGGGISSSPEYGDDRAMGLAARDQCRVMRVVQEYAVDAR